MAKTPRIYLRLNLSLADFAAVWSELETITRERITKEKIMNILLTNLAKQIRLNATHHVPTSPSELARFFEVRGVSLTGDNRRLLDEHVQRELHGKLKPPTEADEKALNLQSSFKALGIQNAPLMKFGVQTEHEPTSTTEQAEQELAPTPKLSMQEILAKQQAAWNESAKLDKQANQEIHRKIKKVS